MDAEKVQGERGGDNQWVQPVLPESSDTPGDELFHEKRGVGSADRLEADLTCSIGQSVDDEVVVSLEVAAPIFGECEKEPVKIQNEPDAQLPWILLIQIVECAGVAGELGLAAVTEPSWRARDEFGARASSTTTPSIALRS